MERNPYRSSFSTVTPRSLADLFGEGKDLDVDDSLRLTYRVLPWKRIIVTVHVRPEPTLAGWIEKVSRKKKSVELFVEKSEKLAYAQFRVVRSYEVRLEQAGMSYTHPLADVDDVIQGRFLVDSRVSFALEKGELRFFVSSYDPAELAPKFDLAFPWEELELPPLLGRTWSIKL